MGTRSTIALEFADGTVGQVYCHWDGYLEHNGAVLQKHYTDSAKVRELIELGDLSSLDKEIGLNHRFDNRVEGWCTFYGRDRHENGVSAKHFASFEDYVANHQYQEFEYILRRDGVWYVCQDWEYVPLAKALAELEKEFDDQ